MLKITGLILIVISTTVIFNIQMISDYRSYVLLNDTLKLLQLLKIECGTGKSYPQIFNGINTGSYKNVSFENAERFIRGLSVKPEIKNEMASLFSQLGKRTKEQEAEFIQQNIEYYQYKTDALKENYDKNHKANFLAGISLGLIIFITLI